MTRQPQYHCRLGRILTAFLVAFGGFTDAFAPVCSTGTLKSKNALTTTSSFVTLPMTRSEETEGPKVATNIKEQAMLATLAGATPAMVALFSSLPADAATDGAFFPVASALVAYAHYASLLVATGALVTERLTVKPDMTEEDEANFLLADTLYGVSGLTLGISGYYRVTEYGKGWDFYSHEPIFWLKLVLASVWGASSFFPTIQMIKRDLERRKTGTRPPMTEKLAKRLTQVINAELLALAAIPLSATLMSRGVFYSNDIPWQIGATFVVLTLGGLGFKYSKEALTWTEESKVVVTEE